MRPYYRIRFDDGATFDYSGDRAAMRAEVAQFSPADVAGYERFMAQSEAIFRVGFEELGHVPFGRDPRHAARSPPIWCGSAAIAASTTWWRSIIRDERLRTIFSFHPLLIGGSPFRASAIYCLIAHLERRWGVHFAMGGTGRLVDGLVDLIAGQGGFAPLRARRSPRSRCRAARRRACG